jgi:hypothetical protein
MKRIEATEGVIGEGVTHGQFSSVRFEAINPEPRCQERTGPSGDLRVEGCRFGTVGSRGMTSGRAPASWRHDVARANY